MRSEANEEVVGSPDNYQISTTLGYWVTGDANHGRENTGNKSLGLMNLMSLVLLFEFEGPMDHPGGHDFLSSTKSSFRSQLKYNFVLLPLCSH